jgi:putative transposase
MPDYRRVRLEGATYFFTLVTHQRRRFLTRPLVRRVLRRAWARVARAKPFDTVAVCLLPDHLHCIWALPQGDADFPGRWRAIKGHFTRELRRAGQGRAAASPSRHRKREAAVWQRRFWEHWIRDEEDLRRHIDYVHFNPVKHGYVAAAADWPWSSFHRYVRDGWYPSDWGSVEPSDLPPQETLGEVL